MLNEGFKYMENNLSTNTGSEVTLLTLGSPHQGGSEGQYPNADPSNRERILLGNLTWSYFV